jgi:outer membrane protein assembly factor BamB
VQSQIAPNFFLGVQLKVIRGAAIFLLLAFALVGSASAQDVGSPYKPGVMRRFIVIRHGGVKVADAMRASAAGSMIPLWKGSFTSSSKVYPFVMVGTDPSKGSVSTTIPTVVVPLIFKFHDGTLIHTLSPRTTVCHGTRSATILTRNSPIFQSVPYPMTSTAIGTTQYLDAFQRANFWNDVSTTSPDYHVLLSKTGQTAGVVVSVPAGMGSSFPGACARARVGTVDVNWFDGTVIPSLLLKIAALKPTVFPIFLSYNVSLDDGTDGIAGYHSDIKNAKGIQTYAFAAFDDSDDISGLSHEVGEWMNDPLAITNENVTPSWGPSGQVTSGCQGNLEVGDPLTNNFDVTRANFTYHLQDLAFLPWFAQAVSSSSVNGWFDFTNEFAAAAVPCSVWPMFHHDLRHTGLSTVDTSANVGMKKWVFPATGNQVQSSAAIGADGTIYVGSGDDNLYAVNPDGTPKWKFATGAGVTSPAIGADGTIYIGSADGNLYAVTDGGQGTVTKKWVFPAGGGSYSPTIGADETIYVSSGSLYALIDNGTNATQKWAFAFPNNAFVESSPAIGADGTIYVGTFEFDSQHIPSPSRIYALIDNGTGATQKWAFLTGFLVSSTPAIAADGTIYVSQGDNTLYALTDNGASVTQKWAFSPGGGKIALSSPAIGADGTVYYGSGDHSLYAVNPSGTPKWAFPTGSFVTSSPAIGADGIIYFGSADNNLYAVIDGGQGVVTKKWAFPTGGSVYSSPAIGADGTIYVGSNDGNLYAAGTP